MLVTGGLVNGIASSVIPSKYQKPIAQQSISLQKTWNPQTALQEPLPCQCSPVIWWHNSITIHINNFVTALLPLPVQFCHNVLQRQWFNWFISLCYFPIWIYIQNKLYEHNVTWHLSPATSLCTSCIASQLQCSINSYNWWSSSVVYCVYWQFNMSFYFPTWCTISLLNLLCSSTCFEQYYAHLQEDLIVSIQHLVPDFVTLLRWAFGAQVKRGRSPLLTCAPNGHLRRVTKSGTRCCIDTIKSSWRWA